MDPLVAMKYIANLLSVPYISVYEVATFYTMYNLGSCWKTFCAGLHNHTLLIRGADKIVKLVKKKSHQMKTKFQTKKEIVHGWVECLGHV